jgi:TfoX/Sxy family transcriptional regulator of competence genes
MLGCYGVYTDGLCFAIATGGEAFLKVDGETEATFSTAGSSPFIYEARASRGRHLARLPTEAYDDADALPVGRFGPWCGSAQRDRKEETPRSRFDLVR